MANDPNYRSMLDDQGITGGVAEGLDESPVSLNGVLMSIATINHPHSAVSNAMSHSFRNWGESDDKYRRTFKKVTNDALGIIDTAFGEMTDYSPFGYHFWWVRQHMRFQDIKSEQTRLVYELMYEFLGRFARNELQQLEQSKSKKSRRASANIAE